MIKAIYTSYLERAKNEKLPNKITSPKEILKYYKDLAHQMYLESLKEAEEAEDNDFEPVEEAIEECPICIDEEELRAYIRSCVITRNIKYIIIHCTATLTSATATAIQNYWKNNLKWKNPGYHILFHYEKGFTVMADFDVVSNGVAGFNSNSINLSYIGGIDKNGKPIDNRSESQKRLIGIAIDELKALLGDNLIIQGHRDFPKVKKACPCYNVKDELK